MLLAGDAISESPISALPEASSVVDASAVDQILTSRNGYHPELQVYIEGLPDVICTATPPDAKSTGYSVDLDGTNDYLATSNITDLTPSGDFTLLLWFNPDAWTGGGFVTPLWSWSDSPKTKGYDLSIDDTSSNAVRIYSRTTTQQTSTLAASLSKWQCLVVSQGGTYGMETRFLLVTFNSDGTIYSTQREFVSGYSAATGPTRAQRDSDSAALTATMEFGKIRTSAKYFDGKIGQFAFFTRAMAASEMERIVYRIFDAKWSGFWDYLTAQILFSEGTGSIARNTASTGSTYNVSSFANGAAWSATQPYTITYRPYMSAISAAGQDLEARATRTSISGISFSLLDTADWMTAYLKRAAQAVRRKSAYIFMGFDEINEEDYRLVMNGSIESIDPLKQRGYEVRIGDAVRFAKASMALGRTKLSSAIISTTTTIPVDSLYGFAGVTAAQYLSVAGSGNPIGYLRIDNEIIGYDGIQASPPAFVLSGTSLRGLWTSRTTATAAASHDSGASVQEVFFAGSGYNNVIDLALELLLSTTGGYVTHSSYDAFAKYTATNGSTTDGRGAAMALADIDVTDILVVKTAYYSTYIGDALITDSVDNIKDWIEENLLRPIGAFFYVKSTGKLSIGTWNTPSSSGLSRIEQTDQSQPEPTVDFSRIINSIEVRYDWDPIAGTYDGIVVYEDLDSGRDHGPTPTLRIDSPWIRTKSLDDFTTYSPSPATITAALKTLLFARFKNPQAIVSITTGLRWIAQELGSGVKYQHEEIPDLVQGFRGLQGELMQIVGRTLDPKRARMNFKVMRTP